jgi:hypothetical protein
LKKCKDHGPSGRSKSSYKVGDIVDQLQRVVDQVQRGISKPEQSIILKRLQYARLMKEKSSLVTDATRAALGFVSLLLVGHINVFIACNIYI